jgi:hypothetical protein
MTPIERATLVKGDKLIRTTPSQGNADIKAGDPYVFLGHGLGSRNYTVRNMRTRESRNYDSAWMEKHFSLASPIQRAKAWYACVEAARAERAKA